MKKLAPAMFAVLAACVAVGCKVGPNYHRPTVQTPTEYRELKDGPQVQVQPQVASYADLPWWQVFQDPTLQELIRTALKQNYDLQLATERINAGRAQVQITRSNLFPQVAGNGDFSGGKPTPRSSWTSSASCGARLRLRARNCWRRRMRDKR